MTKSIEDKNKQPHRNCVSLETMSIYEVNVIDSTTHTHNGHITA